MKPSGDKKPFRLHQHGSASLLFIIMLQLISIYVTGQTYDSSAAAAYADLWACPESDPLKHNPEYHYYSNNDCANFVSQCLIAGGLSLNAGPGLDPYGDGCIPFCDNLHTHLVTYQNVTYERRTNGYPDWFIKGDVVLFGNKAYSGDYWEHTAINVVSGTPALDAHTNNRCQRPVSFFYPGEPGKFWTADFYHINIPQPDLIIQSAQVTPTTFISGSTVTLTCTVKNQGTGSSALSSVGIWLSANQVFEGSPTDTYLGEMSAPSLNPDATSSPTAKQVTVPSGISPGSWNLALLADWNSSVNESNETNNQLFIPVTVVPLCITPGIPVSITASATNEYSANISWSPGNPPGSESISYYWVIGTSPTVTYGNGVLQGTTSGTATSVSALSPGTTYYARVYAFTDCNNSHSDYGTSALFTTPFSTVKIQQLNLASGWNLASFFVTTGAATPGQVFGSYPCILQIKNMTKSWDPLVPDFLNTLTTFPNGEGYFIKSQNACLIELTGPYSGNDYTLNLTNGWNLVGYPYEICQSVSSALKELTDAGMLVQIKNTTLSYDPSVPDFLNNLKNLVPGEGYFLKINGNYSNFRIPTPTTCTKSSMSKPGILVSWQPTIYENSMVFYGQITLDNLPVPVNGYIGAFAGNECRATGKLIHNDGKSYISLVINGNIKESITFLLDCGGKVYSSESILRLMPGEWGKPTMLLPFYSSSRVVAPELRVYPNPFNSILQIKVNLAGPEHTDLTIYNFASVAVKTFAIDATGPGSYNLTWDSRDLSGNLCPPGIYFLRLTGKTGNAVMKVALQR